MNQRKMVVIMAHKIPDPDAIGAAVGLYRLGLSLGRKAHIVMNEVTISVRAMVDELNKVVFMMKICSLITNKQLRSQMKTRY